MKVYEDSFGREINDLVTTTEIAITQTRRGKIQFAAVPAYCAGSVVNSPFAAPFQCPKP